jgi:hypothetical protein
MTQNWTRRSVRAGAPDEVARRIEVDYGIVEPPDHRRHGDKIGIVVTAGNPAICAGDKGDHFTSF